MIVDETKRVLRADATTIRMLRDDRLEVTAWAGIPDDVARRLPSFHRDEGWVDEVLRTGHVLAFPDVRPGPELRHRAVRRRSSRSPVISPRR